MNLLDQAQRRVNQERVSTRIEQNRREQRESEYQRAFAYLDAQQAVVGSGLEELGYMEIQRLREELTKMYHETEGDPYNSDDVPAGGPQSIIYRKEG